MTQFWNKRSTFSKAAIVTVGGVAGGVGALWTIALAILLTGCLSVGYCGG